MSFHGDLLKCGGTVRKQRKPHKEDSSLSINSGVDARRRLEGIADRTSLSVEPANIGAHAQDEQRIVGALDAVLGHTVEGWAMDVKNPGSPVTVEILDGQALLGSVVASMFRADSLAAGIGTGKHHFKFLLPDSVLTGIHTIEARPVGSTEGDVSGQPAQPFSRKAPPTSPLNKVMNLPQQKSPLGCWKLSTATGGLWMEYGT